MKLAPLVLVTLASSARTQVTTLWSNIEPAPSFPIQTFLGTHLVLGASQDAYVAGTGYAGGPLEVRLARIAPDGTTAWSVHAPLPAAVDVVGLVVSQQDGSATVGLGGVGGLACMKFDAAGNLLWTSAVYTGPLATYNAAGRSFVADAAGNLYLCGTTNTGPNYATDWDACVVSFDPQGNQRFATLIPGPLARRDRATHLLPDASSGAFVVVGTFDADDEYGGRSTFLARLTTAGVVTTLTTHAASPQNFVNVGGADVDGQGRVHLLRRTGPTSTSVSVTDLARYDSSNLPLASVSFSYAVARPASFDVVDDGRVVVCGSMNSGGQPGFVARFDAGLQLASQAFLSLGGATGHYLAHVVVESNDDATVAGFVSSPTGLGEISVPLVYRLDAAGNTRWTSMDPLGSNVGFPARPIVDDSGRTWVAITRSAGSFTSVETLALEPQSHSLCHGDATSTACPCGNPSGALAQAGCANSTGDAAKLVDTGDPSVSSDSLVLTCSGMDTTAIALLAEATSTTAPIGFGDGVRCFGGTLLRLYIHASSGGVSSFPAPGDPSILAQSNALGGTITAGSKRLYQVYYRDASLSFCPSPTGGTFNLSNALWIAWRN